MLYLTSSFVDAHSIVHDVIYTNGFCALKSHAGWTTMCIIDIDEMDACALVLKGYRLFAVESINELDVFGHRRVFVHDMAAAIKYREEICYT